MQYRETCQGGLESMVSADSGKATFRKLRSREGVPYEQPGGGRIRVVRGNLRSNLLAPGVQKKRVPIKAGGRSIADAKSDCTRHDVDRKEKKDGVTRNKQPEEGLERPGHQLG